MQPLLRKEVLDALCQQVVEKVVFRRLFKNIQMQGTRNPEE
jgi:hypothetical protein